MSNAVPVAVIIGIFACCASGAIAREGPDVTSPTKISILSCETIFLNALIASCASPLLSATTSSIFLPLIPPAAFISFTFNLNPFIALVPYCATFPVNAPITPTFITFLSLDVFAPQLSTNNANNETKNNIFFIVFFFLSSLFNL